MGIFSKETVTKGISHYQQDQREFFVKRLSVCYVLVSRGQDDYPSMAYLSCQALRRIHPNAKVTLLYDKASESVLSRQYPHLLDLADERNAQPVNDLSPKAVSRYLKVTMRQWVRGDVLYLDSDTLPVRPFSEIGDLSCDFAAVQDRTHLNPLEPAFPSHIVPFYQQLGWPCPLPRYFNAGVLFLRDNPRTVDFSTQWHTRWLQNVALNRIDDQPSFNKAIHESTMKIVELPTSYNAMVSVHPYHARTAKIYHFFVGNLDDLGQTLFAYLLIKYKETGLIDWEAIDRCVKLDHPWMPPYWPKRLWQTGNRLTAMKTLIQQRLGLSGKLSNTQC